MDAFQLTVTHDLGIGVVDFQRAEQGDEGCTLGWRTGVVGFAVLVEASLVADAERVQVVSYGVSADHLLGPSEVQLSVAGDVVVVAAAVPAFGTVHLVKPFETQMLVRPARRTVNHNQIYSSHSLRV